MTILAKKADIGTYVISSLLTDGSNEFRWDMYVVIEDLRNQDWYPDCWINCIAGDDDCENQCDVPDKLIEAGPTDCRSSCKYNDDECLTACD